MYKQNRSWMYDKNAVLYGMQSNFLEGCGEFIKFALEHPDYMSGDKIRCPCSKCRNLKFKDPEDVGWDLYAEGFISNYYNWTCHGEPLDPSLAPRIVGSSRNVPNEMSGWGDRDQMRWDQIMVYDAYGPSMSEFNPPQPCNDPPEASTSYQADADENPIFYQSYVDEGLAERFQGVLKAADQPLYVDCEAYSQLSAVTEFMNIKVEYNLPETCMSRVLQSVGGMLPCDHSLPDS
ncbi:unnamed protein product [Cuscuta epithymum]|uniref:Transposase-associated domain-containing protein n=1 Tax=Cuscuta epithymum TaxID=186058 RepID=A0AAV0GCD5_9ASTE|nr:unnamed protein product [Cuscuta epithymum]